MLGTYYIRPNIMFFSQSQFLSHPGRTGQFSIAIRQTR